jgi:hypothetical protein
VDKGKEKSDEEILMDYQIYMVWEMANVAMREIHAQLKSELEKELNKVNE